MLDWVIRVIIRIIRVMDTRGASRLIKRTINKFSVQLSLRVGGHQWEGYGREQFVLFSKISLRYPPTLSGPRGDLIWVTRWIRIKQG